MGSRAKFLLVAFLTFFQAGVKAQDFYANGDEKRLLNVVKGTLHIIQTGNSEVDDFLAKAVEKHWTLSPVKTISKSEINGFLRNELNYFITLFSWDSFNKELTLPCSDLRKCGSIGIFDGESKELRKNFSFYLPHNSDFFIPRNPSILDFEMAVKALNDMIKVSVNKKYKNDGSGGYTSQVFKAISADNAGIIKDKILLIDKQQAKYYKIKESWLKDHKFQYQIMDYKDIVKLLESGDKKYCYCFLDRYGLAGSMHVYDVESKSIVYATGVRGFSGKVNEDYFEAMSDCVMKKKCE